MAQSTSVENDPVPSTSASDTVVMPAVDKDYALKIYKYPIDVSTKFDIASIILKSCENKDPFMSGVPKRTIVDNLGLSRQDIEKYCNKSHAVDNTKTFKYFLENYNNVDNLTPTVSYDSLRQLILSYYLEKQNNLPSIYTILDDIWENLDLPNSGTDAYTAEKLKLDLFINGFVLECYPGSRRQYIIEDPNNVMNRVLYFEKLAKYRKRACKIVHVLKIYNWLVIISPQIKLRQGFLKFNKNHMTEKVLLNHLLPNMPENTVVVLDNCLRRAKTKLPNEYASKNDMEAWLTKIGVAHCKHMHKSELFKLVRKYKKLDKEKYYLEEILEAYGHTVLWKPKLSNIYSFTGVLKLMLKKLEAVNQLSTLDTAFANAIRNTPLSTWKQYDMFVAEQEKRCLAEDLAVTEVVDVIKLGARNNLSVLFGLYNCHYRNPLEDPAFLSSIIVTA